jgi:hypothetical protein
MREGGLPSILARFILTLLYVGVFLTAPLQAFPGSMAPARSHSLILRGPRESPLKVRLRTRSYTAPRGRQASWGERATREENGLEKLPPARLDLGARPTPVPTLLTSILQHPGRLTTPMIRPLRC